MHGFWFTVESVAAGIILVSFVAFLAASSIESPPEDLTPLAYSILQDLNTQGILKTHAPASNHTAINENVKVSAFKHSVQICTLSSCTGTRPSAGNVWVGKYIIPGNATFNPLEVRLYIYR